MLNVLRSMTLLYAEDEPRTADAMASYFADYFQAVLHAKDGDEAWQLFTRHRIDAAILDICMPHCDGLRVAEKIRKYNDTIPIVIITAHTDKTRLMRAIPLKLVSYLEKPVTPRKLKETLMHIARSLHSCSRHIVRIGTQCYWDAHREQLFVQDTVVKLTASERTLLSILSRHIDQNVSFETIIAYFWERSRDDGTITHNALKTLVSALRKKLPKGSIQSCYGYGYRLISV